MTAEIVVANKSAIALAADSKVTIGSSRMSKTYDTVNKLFTLSKVHPVGVMIYGNADFMEYPWETIIKMYRSQIGRKSFPTIEEWSKDFVKYVKSFGEITEEYKKENIKSICESWFEDAIDEAENAAFAENITLGTPDFIEILKDIMSIRVDEIVEKNHGVARDTKKRLSKNTVNMLMK